jgi:hypothetical protein
VELFEKYKFFIYLLIGILYFLFKGRKRKLNQPKPVINSEGSEVKNQNKVGQKRKDYKPPVPKPPAFDPFSLEDIFKEFQKGTKPQMLEKPSDNSTLEILSPNPKVEYEKLESREESKTNHSVFDEKDKKDRADAYSSESNKTNQYSELIKNPESLKKVIVAQEILKPKYF